MLSGKGETTVDSGMLVWKGERERERQKTIRGREKQTGDSEERNEKMEMEVNG